MPATMLAECAACSVLVHVARARAAECPRCRGALARGLVDVGFHDARQVYGAPGDPWLPPPEREGAILRCADGHKARSREERVIDDWLDKRGILHEREPKLKGMRPDWRVGDVYIEYWGMANQQGYEARRAAKVAMYRERRLRLVELFPEDLAHLETKLGFLAHVAAPRLDGSFPASVK
ncbi:MAG TPA: hypothetical protein VFH78_13525 [Candidatus Thermoplasmatota archaeon]|nr:hypothetical protein [Candidatus Thermoplasmatota archaeon]